MRTKLSKNLFIFFVSVLIFCMMSCHVADAASIGNQSILNNYLAKPTGQYGVGFEDVHWINQGICPDPTYNGKNNNDFSADNPKYCHELMIRIYYPTILKNQLGAPYYKPIQQELLTTPEITTEQGKQLVKQINNLKSYSVEKAPIVTGKIFPVLLFSPGGGFPAEMYENFITELVSRGYIVVAVNTSFVNRVALPNGHIITDGILSPETENKRVIQDLSYTYKKIHMLHNTDAIFSAMDLHHIGALGHSCGARAIADLAHTHPSWFQAAAALDIATVTHDDELRKYNLPFMYELSSFRNMSIFPQPVKFIKPLELGHNNYLVVISPNQQDYNYSHHINFTDLATLQYLSAWKTYQQNSEENSLNNFDLKFLSHEPLKKDARNFANNKDTFLFIRNKNQWSLLYYHNGINMGNLNILGIKNLDIVLAGLPKKTLESFTASEVLPIRNAMISFQRTYVDILGTGNGLEITNAINKYLVTFFNVYLKNEKTYSFNTCAVMSKNTYLRCGPAVTRIMN